MSPERMRQLNSQKSGKLTPKEMREGWHFCYDWDGLLVNINDTEGEGACCTCGSWTEAEITYAAAYTEQKQKENHD